MTEKTKKVENQAQKSQRKTRRIVLIGVLAAISAVLAYINFSVPFMPSFIKLDISDFPALIASFAMGPVSGVIVCLIKNLLHLLSTSTGGVGELSNFILSAVFVLIAGLIYKKSKTKKSAILGSVLGAAAMAFVGLFSNYYLVYPVYENFMPIEAILNAYKVINPAADTLWEALLMFNVPFTFFKGMLSVIITIFIYKPISRLIKNK